MVPSHGGPSGQKRGLSPLCQLRVEFSLNTSSRNGKGAHPDFPEP